ncbi:MAG: hypothetical protein ANABAC_3000 [Anaerolineae bacterium]|nr:MAG: hypothetical protein ANABAC_3000 [Anaerolineae bacterium]
MTVARCWFLPRNPAKYLLLADRQQEVFPCERERILDKVRVIAAQGDQLS